MSGYEENTKFNESSSDSGMITYDDGRERTLSSREAERRKSLRRSPLEKSARYVGSGIRNLSRKLFTR